MVKMHIVLAHLVVFRHLDRGQHVGDAGEAQQIEIGDQRFGHALARPVWRARLPR